jgi:molybdopterin molybdotransferase
VIPLDDARAVVLAGCRPLAPVRWPLQVADGCVTAESVAAADPVPTFDNSAMDGYGVRAADVADASAEAAVSLTVVAAVFAGHPVDITVQPGHCVRIMTGAPVPAGVDAVVPVERTSTGQWSPDAVSSESAPAAPASPGDASPPAEVVVFTAPATVGDHIRRAGDDVAAGDVVVACGATLTPARLGVLAGVGRSSVTVHPRVRVGVFTTGDELVDPAWPLAPGQIRDTNRVVLLAMLARDGFEPVDLGRVGDHEAALTAAITNAAACCDALITTGGVSMGQVDLVRVVLDRLGDMHWMQVAIKPAKPFAFGVVGSRRRQVPVFGLPGNPVSSAVSYELLARPGLRRIAGHDLNNLVRPTVTATAVGELRRRRDGKVHFARVVATPGPDGGWTVTTAGSQGSHQLSVMAASNALAVLADGDGVADGETVDILVLD